MTTTPVEDVVLGSALATLWQRHRQTNLDRISLLEATAANVLRAMVDDDAVAEGASAAHKLAGSLGTFGFDAGSRAALEAESLLREPVIDGRLLAEAVTALRASVEEVGDTPGPVPAPAGPVPDPASSDDVVPSSGFAARLVSSDPDLVSRLTVEAAAIGIAVVATTEMPFADSLRPGGPEIVVLDATGTGSPTFSKMAESVAELSRKTLVVVLTDKEEFEDRVELAKAGAGGVLPRSQAARQTVSFLAEALARRHPAPSTVLVLNTDAGVLETLRDTLAGPVCRVEIRDDPTEFWEALEELGADLVVVGYQGSQLSGPELCRMIRAHPRWCRLPIIVVGTRDPAQLDEAMSAGADDYLDKNLSPRDLGVRLHNSLEQGQLARARCDTDPLTGTQNRTAAERSLDRLFRLSARHGDPFALALVTVDQLDQIRETEGNAMGDVVLRHLAARLLGGFRGEDVVGRWTHDGFVIGAYRATGEQASERITAVLEAFTAEELPATSGKVARCTFSAGVASTPTDGSSLASLERLGETALRRAQAGQNRVVSAGERPAAGAPNLVDVVLVEDDDSVADVIEHALGLRQYEFVRFSDGAEAARALGEGEVKGRIVLLDIGLPSLDGFGVLKMLRIHGVLDDTRVIMLTARSSEAEMLRALGLGATEHIAKPFSVPLLLGRLDQTLSRSMS